MTDSRGKRDRKGAEDTAPPPPVLTALHAISWIAFGTIPPGPDRDEGGKFNFAGSQEDYDRAERQLVAALAAGDLIAEAYEPNPRYSAGPIQMRGDGPLLEVPSKVFRDLGVGIFFTGSICGRPGRDGRKENIPSYNGPFYAAAQFQTKDIIRLWPSHPAARPGKVSDSTVEEWIMKHYQDKIEQGKPPLKREAVIAECIKATRATYRQVRLAIGKVPDHLKNARGRAKKQME